MTRADPPAPQSQRLDVWLDIACLFKTRSEAQRACRAGKVDVNGQSAKPNRVLKVGDDVAITRAAGRRQTVKVLAFVERHIDKGQARLLYEDTTPPPTAEELERRALDRMIRVAAPAPPTTPDRRARRELRRLKGW